MMRPGGCEEQWSGVAEFFFMLMVAVGCEQRTSINEVIVNWMWL